MIKNMSIKDPQKFKDAFSLQVTDTPNSADKPFGPSLSFRGNMYILGYVYVKFPGNEIWKNYYCNYSEKCLLFCSSVAKNDFLCSYFIYLTDVNLCETFCDLDN